MGVLTIVLYTVVVIVALMIIGLVLIQQSKSGGFGSAFGGAGEAVFGAQAGNHLTRLTVILTTIFFVLVLVLAVITGHRERDQGAVKENAAALVGDSKQTDSASQPASSENDEKIKKAADGLLNATTVPAGDVTPSEKRAPADKTAGSTEKKSNVQK